MTSLKGTIGLLVWRRTLPAGFEGLGWLLGLLLLRLPTQAAAEALLGNLQDGAFKDAPALLPALLLRDVRLGSVTNYWVC